MGIKGWANYKLGDLVTFQRGHDLPVSNTTAGPYPVVGSNGTIAYHTSYTTKKPCITVGRSGNSVGVVHYYNCNCWAHNTTLYVKEFKNNIHPKFLYYYIKTLHLDNYGGGSAVPTLNRNHIHPIEVCVPVNHEEQRAIAHILSSLDKKIELNNRINKTLEEMAQAIFKSWFVDFEPFRDGEFEDSELGEIPKGWKVKNLPEVIDINPSRQLKKGAIAPYVEMKNLPDSYARIRNWEYRSFSQSGAKFKNGDVLLARITPCLENGKTGYVDFLKKDEIGWGSTEYIVFAPKNKLSGIFLYILCRSEHFRSHAIANMTGTSGRQRVPASCFQDYKIIVPNVDSLERFNHVTKAFFTMMKKNDFESHYLSVIRDTLLPKLMSGEIRVPLDISGKEAD